MFGDRSCSYLSIKKSNMRHNDGVMRVKEYRGGGMKRGMKQEQTRNRNRQKDTRTEVHRDGQTHKYKKL